MRHRLMQHLFGAAVIGVCIAGAESEKSDRASDVSIESAKREFDTLREAPGISSESQLRLPDIGGPQLPMAEEPSNAMVPTQKTTLLERRKKERSQNWLLDAMLEKPEAATKTDSLKKEQEKLRADPFERMIAEQLSPTKQNEDEEAAMAKADQIEDQVVNPLTDFMAGWVSDQDRELLVPDTKQTPARGGWEMPSDRHRLLRSVARHPILIFPPRCGILINWRIPWKPILTLIFKLPLLRSRCVVRRLNLSRSLVVNPLIEHLWSQPRQHARRGPYRL